MVIWSTVIPDKFWKIQGSRSFTQRGWLAYLQIVACLRAALRISFSWVRGVKWVAKSFVTGKTALTNATAGVSLSLKSSKCWRRFRHISFQLKSLDCVLSTRLDQLVSFCNGIWLTFPYLVFWANPSFGKLVLSPERKFVPNALSICFAFRWNCELEIRLNDYLFFVLHLLITWVQQKMKVISLFFVKNITSNCNELAQAKFFS